MEKIHTGFHGAAYFTGILSDLKNNYYFCFKQIEPGKIILAANK